ncbi:EthD family reductase [Mesorhizobium sp. B2-4-14]|uniref:EthD family reductase n=1 Tax=Mesorhizobium sp. B2-4-14 TaxID=2589935 RepID=UPI001127626A|nr:EthD family reductase [Mesorhizobium sp. B2-4-14]TPL11485.1 EthD family reductase [Mesorhizobium sp. B2-4-14]
MIKVSVMYPASLGTRFDHDYYRDRHLPLIKSRMGPALKYYAIDRKLADGMAEIPATYVATCHLLCDSVQAYQSAYGPHAQEISGDIRNFTDRTPIVQISEVVVENSARGETEALRHSARSP